MQTDWDARPFLGCCEELLGAKVDYKNGTVLSRDGRLVRVRVFPASTDPLAIEQSMRSTAVVTARQRLLTWTDRRRQRDKTDDHSR